MTTDNLKRGNQTTPAVEAFNYGWRCRLQSECDNPYPAGAQEHSWWESGWNRCNGHIAEWEDIILARQQIANNEIEALRLANEGRRRKRGQSA